MKVSEILKDGKYSISFEVFPPKLDVNFETIEAAAEQIAKLFPAFMSVTYGASGTGGKYTMRMAEDIEKKYGVPVIAHLTCVSSTEKSVSEAIAEIKKRKIKNVMALRGDLPPEQDIGGLEYAHAYQLVNRLRAEMPDVCIGGACYPEVHPESRDQAEDIRHLKEKVDCGLDFLTTQMFFDNNLLFNFLYKIREAGITVPVVPGIMPITNGTQVERAIKLSGSFMPQRFKSIVDKFSFDPDAMMQAGVAYATDQIIDLFANGIKHVHVYSMNKPAVAEAICENLSSIIGKRAK